MYKAGDFTNGKMNEIFKEASSPMVAKAYDSGKSRYGAKIKHKQFGDFILVDSELLAVKSAYLYCVIAGMDIVDFYKKYGDGSKDANERQLDAIDALITPCCDTEHDRIDWLDAYFKLSDRLSAIMDRSDGDDLANYMELISNVK